MREVIVKNVPSDVVHISCVSEDKYYGLDINYVRLILVKYNHGFYFLSKNEFEKYLQCGLNYQDCHGGTKKEAVEYFKLQRGRVVFEFDSFEELLNWFYD